MVDKRVECILGRRPADPIADGSPREHGPLPAFVVIAVADETKIETYGPACNRNLVVHAPGFREDLARAKHARAFRGIGDKYVYIAMNRRIEGVGQHLRVAQHHIGHHLAQAREKRAQRRPAATAGKDFKGSVRGPCLPFIDAPARQQKQIAPRFVGGIRGMYAVSATGPGAISGLHREKTQIHQFAAARRFAPAIARTAIPHHDQQERSRPAHLDFPGRLGQLCAVEASEAVYGIARPREFHLGHDLNMACDVGKNPGLLGAGFLPQHDQVQFWFGVHRASPLSATVAGRGPR